MVGVIELSVAPNFREEAQQCLHLASAEPEGELRTILEGMARGWLKMADCAWVPQEPEIPPVELIAQDYVVLRPSGPILFGLLKAVSSSRTEGWCENDERAGYNARMPGSSPPAVRRMSLPMRISAPQGQKSTAAA
jgi:hypothetical protein